MARALRALLLVAAVAALVTGVVFAVRPRAPSRATTVADLSVVHPGVRVQDTERRGLVRVSPGHAVETDAQGRARLRLDDGTRVLVDRSTRVVVADGKLDLVSGRVFVEGVPDARVALVVGAAQVRPGAARVGFERREGPARVYAANEEIVVVAGGTEHKVRAGESALIEGAEVAVRPEKAFDDWTGGLAAPWGAAGPPRRAVGEVWGAEPTAAPGDPGSPLTIRSLDVVAKVEAEVAETRVTTTYFNGGSQAVRGDFRMALPPGAIVSEFAWGREGALERGWVAPAARHPSALTPQGGALLEWAGEGWVRGHLPSIPSGAAVTVVIEYIEWLPVRRDAGKLLAQYRFPLAASGDPPLIGEFSARVEASPARPRSIAASAGLNIEGTTVRVRRPDFRPTADLVVDVELPPWDSNARLYLAKKDGDEDAATVLIRADLPDARPDAGATLALVVDTSGSAEPAELDVSRAFVRAVLDALGDRDRVVVLAADQSVRPVGPAEMGPLDAARKTAILNALDRLVPGGATDLGRALEAGADALPADAPAGVVVYVGDGWATVGDLDVTGIEARLARHARGKPRLGAVAVGPTSNVRTLRALTQGSGPLLFASDSAEATAAATDLVADALRPAFAGVELVLGPEIEQVYPRSARAAFAGSTIEAVGRLRTGRAPSAISLRWRDRDGAHEERRLVALHVAPWSDDVRRRWAKARVDELLLARRGREAVTDVAWRAKLLTPWTAFARETRYTATALEARQLDVALSDVLSPWDEVPRARHGDDFAPGTLVSLPPPGQVTDRADERVLADAVAAAAGITIDGAMASVRACRDSRAALRPELSGTLLVTLAIDGQGKARDVKVRGKTPAAHDDALNRCVEVALAGLSYPRSGLGTPVRVEREILLPPPRVALRGTRCSALSALPTALRRGVWRVRLGSEAPLDVFVSAKRQCELNGWTDRRALLELALLVERDGVRRVQLARALETVGEVEAAAFVRREAVRRVRSPDELADVKRELLGDERYPMSSFQKRYRAARDDAERLAVVRQFSTLAPHDGFLKERLIALLEALGKKDELLEEARRVRLDPFTPAEVLADVASALRRLGEDDEARRTFGELSERAPADPWARAFLGDRLRNEGLFDDASRAYLALADLAAHEPASVLRSALAHAGAGRLDLARRLLTRVIETGGRSGQAAAATLAAHVAAALLAEARAGAPPDGLGDALKFAALEVPRAEKRHVLLLRTPAAQPAIEIQLVRRAGKDREALAPDVSAVAMGLHALAFDPTGAEIELVLTRPEALPPTRPYEVRVDTLLPSESVGAPPRLVSTKLELPATGKPVTLSWANGWTVK